LQKPEKEKTGKEKIGEEKVHCYCPGCGHYFGKLGKTSNMYMDCPECGAGNSFIMSGRYKLTVFFERGAKTA
jgi:Zn finger protein HypA/HybF involved in hydrogenase expression